MTKITRSNKRTPVGRRQILNAEIKPGFVRRFVNDTEGRIAMFEDAGYQIVRDDSKIADPNAGDASRMGSAVSKHVGRGTNAVLMEIREEFFKEDQLTKSRRIDSLEQSLTQGAGKETYGNLKLSGRPRVDIEQR